MFVEVVGWGGSVAVILAYGLLSTGRITAKSLAFQFMNIAGALGMALNGWAHGALPSVFTNTVWMAIGLLALARLSALPRPVPPKGSRLAFASALWGRRPGARLNARAAER